MQITQHPRAEALELRLTGRIDATWAEHLSSSIESAVRAGCHQVVLNFAGVEYISSLGIRVIIQQYKLLKSVNGSLGISHPNEFCRETFTTVGLASLLLRDDQVQTATVERRPPQTIGSATYEIYPQSVILPLSCAMLGDPSKLSATGFSESDCRTLTFPNGSFGLGIGAFGKNYEDAIDRFGEFLAVGGCAITQPTNEAHALPDFVIEEGGLIPQVETLYALEGAGDFPTMARFDVPAKGPGKIALSELVNTLLALSTAQTIAFVILAETAGLVGATLRKSPAGAPLAHKLPDVRDWLSFTTERSSDKSLALLVGVASTNVPPDAAAFLRPMKNGSDISAHIHAAVFPYRPVQRGELPFGKTVSDLLGVSIPAGVLHLMADTRPFEGVGESELARGACWFGPVSLASSNNIAKG